MNIYFDMHTHTVASGHAFSTFKENVEEAAGKGLFALGMSGSCARHAWLGSFYLF